MVPAREHTQPYLNQIALRPDIVFLSLVNSAGTIRGWIKPGQEVLDVLYPVSAVTPTVDAVSHDPSFITPAPQGIAMDVKKLSHFPRRKHSVHSLIIAHFLLRSSFTQPIPL
jgi:hypothetical protein